MRVLVLMLISLLSSGLSAQVPGRWEGPLAAGGMSLQVLFDIRQTGPDQFSAALSVPAQNAVAVPFSTVRLAGDSLLLYGPGIVYAGLLNAGRTELSGHWRQNGRSFPLLLKRTGDATVLVRPQEPRPPFPYVSEDVTYSNRDQTVRLGATLTKPAGRGPSSPGQSSREPFPVVILISGSGQQDRDQSLFGHKPFLVLADYLTRRGLAVLRVDDRGVGQSTGPLANATSADFAQDVMTSLDYLKTRPDLDPKRIGLIGHSEGGMIAPMVAAQRPNDVAFIVSLAGPGEPISDLMARQNSAGLKAAGISPRLADSYADLYKKLARIAVSAPDTAAAYKQATADFAEWQALMPPLEVYGVTQVNNDASRARFVRQLVNAFRQPWMRYFLAYVPAGDWAKVRCPVLALNGEKDYQVDAQANLSAIATALKTGGNARVQTQVLPGLNHLFQHCTTCTLAEYAQLTETFAPEALQRIGDWLTEQARP